MDFDVLLLTDVTKPNWKGHQLWGVSYLTVYAYMFDKAIIEEAKLTHFNLARPGSTSGKLLTWSHTSGSADSSNTLS